MRLLKELKKKLSNEKDNNTKKNNKGNMRASTSKNKSIKDNSEMLNTSSHDENKKKMSESISKENLAQYIDITENLGDDLKEFYKPASQQIYSQTNTKPKYPKNTINNVENKESQSSSIENALLSKKRERSYNSQNNWEEFSFGKNKRMKFDEIDLDSDTIYNSYPKNNPINKDNYSNSIRLNNTNKSFVIPNSFLDNSKELSSFNENINEKINYSKDLENIIRANSKMLHEYLFLKFDNLQLLNTNDKDKMYYSFVKLIDYNNIAHYLITSNANETYAFFSLNKAIPYDDNLKNYLKFDGIIPHFLDKNDFRFITYLSPCVNNYYTDMNYYTMMDFIYEIEEENSLYKTYLTTKINKIRRYISIGTNKIDAIHKVLNTVYVDNIYYKKLDNIWHEYDGQKVIVVDFISELKKGMHVNIQLFLDKLSEGKMFPATKTENTKDVFWPDYEILILVCSLDFEDLLKKYYHSLYDIIYGRFESISISDEGQLPWLHNKLKDPLYS